MLLCFAASKLILPKPTAKFEIMFTVSDNLLIVSASILSVIDVKIPSHPSLNSINYFREYDSSLEFNFTSKIFEAFSSLNFNNFRVIKIFFRFLLIFWAQVLLYTSLIVPQYEGLEYSYH